MTETPTTAPEILDEDLEVVSMAGRILGGIQGRWEAATAAFNASYRNAAHEELQVAGVCDCPDPAEEAARADAEQLLAEVGKALAKMPKVVVLCGSTRFSEAFRAANLAETLAGRIVLSIGCDMRSDAELFAGYSDEQLASVKERLDELHLRKIDLADEVLILNVGGYIGESTRREIDYAISRGKTLRWLEPGTPDTPEAIAERVRPFVACKAPDPLNPNFFCGRRLGHSEIGCVFMPVEELPASADDEGDETAAKQDPGFGRGLYRPVAAEPVAAGPQSDPEEFRRLLREEMNAAQSRPGHSAA